MEMMEQKQRHPMPLRGETGGEDTAATRKKFGTVLLVSGTEVPF